MAEHDIKTAEKTYESFIGWTKWGTIISAAAVVLVIILLT